MTPARAKAKHTSGWTLRDARDCVLPGCNKDEPLADPQLEANARLIWAAPDLLAAAKAYAAWAQEVPEGAPDLKPIRAQIVAALSKAESAQ